MIRALPLCLLALPAFAEPPQQIIGLGYEEAGLDSITITAESPALGILEYYNHIGQHSHNGTFRVKDGPIDCDVTIRVGDAETASVRCLDGFVSDPPKADVLDGDSFTFIITKPMG